MKASSPSAYRPPYALGAVRNVRSLQATARRLSEAFEPLLKQLKLRQQEYLVLALLWERDGCPLTRIASRLRVAESMVTAWAGPMVQRGLVERGRAGGAERLWLTERGRALQALAPRVPSALLCHVLAWLDHDEVEASERDAAPPAHGPASAPRAETGGCPDGEER